MKTLIRGMRILLCAIAAYALVAPWQTAQCQEPGPPPGPMEAPPSMNVNKQLSKMVKRYGLSDAQKEQIRPILTEEKKKMDELFQNSSLSPEERFNSMRAIHDDEVARISAILSDSQRAKYQKDQENMNRQDGPDGPPPPPLDDSGGGPPPP